MLPVTESEEFFCRENGNELLIMQSLKVIEKREGERKKKDSNYQKQCLVTQDNPQTSASIVFI